MRRIKTHKQILISVVVLVSVLGAHSGKAEDQPNSPANLADKAYTNGDFKKTIWLLTKAIKADPSNGGLYAFRGGSYLQIGDAARAIADYTHALTFSPEDTDDILPRRGSAYVLEGDYAKAIADYTQALKDGPRSRYGTVDAYNDLAWIHATCPIAKFRNGKLAIEEAEAGWKVSMQKHWECVDTLAAAYAETGDFANAVMFEEQFLVVPDLDKNNQIAARKRLALYQAGKPYREK